MEIEVYYSLGGHNYWNGNQDRRGIYISFWPVQRERLEKGIGSVTRTVGDKRGGKMLLQEQKRRHDPRGVWWANFVKKNIDAIAEAAIAQNWTGVASIVTGSSSNAA